MIGPSYGYSALTQRAKIYGLITNAASFLTVDSTNVLVRMANRNPLKRIAALATAIMMLLSTMVPVQAAEERRLKFYFTHTKERIDIVYKRNGKYVPRALKKLNHFLRDWRQDQSTKMDPRLFDLIWSVYQQMDTREAIHVVSAFRAPKTNNMLRRRGRGVAKNSQHTQGKALDYFIPGVNLAKLRATGLLMEVGGVGYYPTSGSPFVHMDTGSVRHWPRMTQKQLSKVFPRGDTTQVPSNGKRQKRYSESLARQKRIAAREISPPNSRRGGVFARVFRRDQEPSTIPTTGQSLSSGNSQAAAAADPIDVVPRAKPSILPTELLPDDIQMAIADIPAPRPMPAELLASRNAAIAAEIATAKINSAQETTERIAALESETEKPQIPERAVASVWSQVGDNHSTDVSKLVAADIDSDEKRGAPDVAKAVMTALNTTREQVGSEPKDTAVEDSSNPKSAAASIAAAILAPAPSDATLSNQGLNGSLVTAYAPSAPRPNTRPAFNAALGFGNTEEQNNSSEIVRDELPSNLGATISNENFTDTRFPVVAPRNKPIEQQLADLPDTVAPPPETADTDAQASQQPVRQRASLSGQVPSSALRKTNSDLKFRGGEQSVLAYMTTPDTTRSEAFAKFKMPNPYKMQNVFQIPVAIVDNNFGLSSTSLRTDKFSGKAIVATKLARLASR